MKVFMIGGTGLLGCEAAIQLIKRGHTVKSVALPPLPQGAPIPEEMELIMANINEKSDDEVLEMLQGCDAFIFAAGVDERVEFKAPVYDSYYKFNIAPLERIFPLCKKRASKGLLFSVHTSHSSQRNIPTDPTSLPKTSISNRVSTRKRSAKKPAMRTSA